VGCGRVRQRRARIERPTLTIPSFGGGARSRRGAVARVAFRPHREQLELAAAALVVAATAVGVWLASGVRLGEVARFVPYELCFVMVPGWLAYRALIPSPGGRLRQLVFGWSLGYLLEILAFMATAAIDRRGLFVVYPLLIGVPAGWLVGRRARASARIDVPRGARAHLSVASLSLGALLCVALLLYATGVSFSENPLPRDTATTSYHEDTVFTISLAGEALHHWPMTVPMVSGEPLHYHLFAYMHMAAISQVTGIDLSTVVLRLYAVPLLLLLALQLVVAGRSVGRALSVGFGAAFVVLFLGELDVSRTKDFLFYDYSFFWLLTSHTFLLGLIFFVPSMVLLGELLADRGLGRRGQTREWLLLMAYLAGCIGAKSYAVLNVMGGLTLLILWQLLRRRALNRRAVLALVLSGALYVLANALVLSWNSAGIVVKPFKTIRTMPGVEDLRGALAPAVGSIDVLFPVEVVYGTVGLLAIPLVGIALLLRQRRLALSATEAWLLALFVAALPPLFFLSQPGRGQLFVVFFGLVPGAVLAASGFLGFWRHHARRALGSRANALATAAVGVLLLLGVLNTPLDWFPGLAGRDAVSTEETAPPALTAGLYEGLRWIRDDTDPDAVLAVNNHSAYLDNRDSKFFYYSAFAERRIVLESWDYTRQTVARGVFSLDAAHTPFPRRLRLSDAAFRRANEAAIRRLGRTYGVRYLVVDKVHGDASPTLARLVPRVYSNDDLDIYAVGRPGHWECVSETVPGISAVFGHRRTLAGASALRRSANRVGFVGLKIEHRDCFDFAVVLNGLSSWAQAKAFQRETAAVGFPVKLEHTCTSQRHAGISAVFGHRRTRFEAAALRTDAERVGFLELTIEQRGCFDFAVVLKGLRDAAQAKDFQEQAATAGFDVRLENITSP
jgi:hypothetical protein